MRPGHRGSPSSASFQVWDFTGAVYDLAMYFVVDDRASCGRGTMLVGTDHLLALMRQAGFTATERLDGRFYQPVLVGTRST